MLNMPAGAMKEQMEAATNDYVLAQSQLTGSSIERKLPAGW